MLHIFQIAVTESIHIYICNLNKSNIDVLKITFQKKRTLFGLNALYLCFMIRK